MNWKSFEKEMPELGQKILVYGFTEDKGKRNSLIMRDMPEGAYSGKLNFIGSDYGVNLDCDYFHKLDTFTHWMPIPEKPETPKSKYKQITVEVNK